MEGHDLTPVIGPKNVRLFQEEQVHAVVVTRRAHVDNRATAGDLAADAFTLFDDGHDVIEVVKRLRVGPELVESLFEHWARLRRKLVLSAEGRSAMCTTLMGWDDGSLRSERDVLAFLEKWVTNESVRRCWVCKREGACLCRACARASVSG